MKVPIVFNMLRVSKKFVNTIMICFECENNLEHSLCVQLLPFIVDDSNCIQLWIAYNQQTGE